MSDEDIPIVPIKLAQRFIHVIDFHADPVTCVSASSGTVSYDSVISPCRTRSDVQMVKQAVRCPMQPPRPHLVSKLHRIIDKGTNESATPIDIERFRAIRRELKLRKSGFTNYSVTYTDKYQSDKAVDDAVKESLVNFHKKKTDETRKAVSRITVEIPYDDSFSILKPKQDFVVNQKCLFPAMSSHILDNYGHTLDGHQQIEMTQKMCPDMLKNE